MSPTRIRGLIAETRDRHYNLTTTTEDSSGLKGEEISTGEVDNASRDWVEGSSGWGR